MSQLTAVQATRAKERVDLETTFDRFQAALHEQRFQFVLSRIDRVDSVLEVGTGAGNFSPRLAARCGRYMGIELDPQSVSLTAQRLGANGTVLQGDARRLPFESLSFSLIVCLEVLEHLGEWMDGVAGIHRTLRRDGIAIISVPYRVRGGKSRLNPYHLYEPGERELVACFRQRFEDVVVYYQFFEETLVMRAARLLHLRRLLGLVEPYRALIAGEPAAIASLGIGQQALGMKLHLLILARRPKPFGVSPYHEA